MGICDGDSGCEEVGIDFEAECGGEAEERT